MPLAVSPRLDPIRSRAARAGIRCALGALLVLLAAAPALAYTVYLKDGSKIAARAKYRIENGMAIIVLQNGTQTSIRAAEIDVARSDAANQTNYGTAVEIDQSGRTQEVANAAPPPPRPKLQDLIASREVGPTTTAPVRREPATPPASAPISPARAALPQAELAAEIQKLFREQGVEEVAVSRGSRATQPLIELTANSSASVFHALKATAATLERVRGAGRRIEAFELILATSNRERAGEFVITPALAAELTGKQIEASAFFVKYVKFD